MTLPVLLLILVTVTLSALAQLALKLGVMNHGAGGGDIHRFVERVAFSPGVWIGLVIYAASVGLWLWVLSKTDLSVAYPFVGVSFVITMIFGALVLHEPVTATRVIGTFLIAAGCVFVARSA